mmetsp:Transcript_9534/g.18286  ORF Transcript_9534/g.18286 Transcript_9534/m.18286 type:complete len:124 (-) Transcript_9534:104-475(-)
MQQQQLFRPQLCRIFCTLTSFAIKVIGPLQPLSVKVQLSMAQINSGSSSSKGSSTNAAAENSNHQSINKLRVTTGMHLRLACPQAGKRANLVSLLSWSNSECMRLAAWNRHERDCGGKGDIVQ